MQDLSPVGQSSCQSHWTLHPLAPPNKLNPAPFAQLCWSLRELGLNWTALEWTGLAHESNLLRPMRVSGSGTSLLAPEHLLSSDSLQKNPRAYSILPWKFIMGGGHDSRLPPSPCPMPAIRPPLMRLSGTESFPKAKAVASSTKHNLALVRACSSCETITYYPRI